MSEKGNGEKMELLKIETPRLLLRRFTVADAEDVFAILSDEQTTPEQRPLLAM